MAENSKISWTDHTFNPWIGCTKVSEGCKHCYAETQNKRYGWTDQWGPEGTRKRTSEANWRKPLAWNRKAEELDTRYKVFCASLADVFEDKLQLIGWRLDLFENIIANTPNLDWLILTKRPAFALRFFNIFPNLLFDNVWMGTTVESRRQSYRIESLFAIPAKVHFVSVEPMLGPIDLYRFLWDDGLYPLDLLDWVICGGESGPGCRPMELDWARNLRDQCHNNDAGVAFFMKQLGGHPDKQDRIEEWPKDLQIQEFPEV